MQRIAIYTSNSCKDKIKKYCSDQKITIADYVREALKHFAKYQTRSTIRNTFQRKFNKHIKYTQAVVVADIENDLFEKIKEINSKHELKMTDLVQEYFNVIDRENGGQLIEAAKKAKRIRKLLPVS